MICDMRTAWMGLMLTMLLGMAGCLSEYCEVYPGRCVAEESDSSSDGDGDGEHADGELPEAPALELSLSQVKQFEFSWAPVDGAEYYQLLESVGEKFGQVGDDLVEERLAVAVPLHFRANASYKLRACNANGCSESAVVGVAGALAEAVGYFKASNTGAEDRFGYSVALSADGRTLAVGAYLEDSNAVGIDGNQADNSSSNAGAVYVFARNGQGVWSQQAYVKASNTGAGDWFGWSVALSEDGSTLAVGARYEDSNAVGVNGNQADNTAIDAGAVYMFVRNWQGLWSQQAYVKASNTGAGDRFGNSVALSGDGSTLAVGSHLEASAAVGINGNQADNSAADAGAVYVFVRNGQGVWSQQAYVKASNAGVHDYFGWSVALSGDASTLAVGALVEDSNAVGINGDQADNSAADAGAVYVFVRNGQGQWSQQAYVKASNTGAGDRFGSSVALSGDSSTLAVGAYLEDSAAMGIDGDQVDTSSSNAGAVYVFARSGQGQWSQQAYVKAAATDAEDRFGQSVALSGDGGTLAVGAHGEDSAAVGINGNPADNSAPDAGAVYVFVRNEQKLWSQHAYVKASNTGEGDSFGCSVALSEDASTLAVGAYLEDSSAVGISGDQGDNLDFASDSGAVYLF